MEPRECAYGCGAQLDDDMGEYCPECQQAGFDPEVLHGQDLPGLTKESG